MTVRIIEDTREQIPWKFSDAVIVERCALAAGDYSLVGLTDRVAIERKSLADLVACVAQERDRFFDCCRRLEEYEFRTLIVECSIPDVLAGAYRSRTKPQSVLGTTLALHVDFGLPTIWAGSAGTAANIAERLLTRIWAKNVGKAS